MISTCHNFVTSLAFNRKDLFLPLEVMVVVAEIRKKCGENGFRAWFPYIFFMIFLFSATELFFVTRENEKGVNPNKEKGLKHVTKCDNSTLNLDFVTFCHKYVDTYKCDKILLVTLCHTPTN
jgi:hypothetical protein